MTETQIAALFEPPTEPRELVRHYTLSEADLAAIRRCRGDHNRLGYALMLCYLRYPGPSAAGRRAAAQPLLAFVAEQIDVLPDGIDDYLAAERNRQRHAVECQARLRLRPFGRHAAAELTDALLAQAIENDRLSVLAEAGDAGMPHARRSSSRRPRRSNVSVLISATGRAGRPSAG